MMSRTTKLLLSVVTVGGMFVLGRLVAGFIQRRGEADSIDDTPVEQIELQTPLGEDIVIEADPLSVYARARELQYFKQFLFGVNDLETADGKSAKLVVTEDGTDYTIELYVIADEPGEFFALRVEHAEQLYGTILVKMEPATVRGASTKVSVSTRYKIELPTPTMNAVKAVVAREVDVYLHALKDMCEHKTPV